MNKSTDVFPSDSFWRTFNRDLRQAQGRVIIQSPFVTIKRLRILQPILLELLHRDVSICVFVQRPQRTNSTVKPSDAETDRIRSFQDCLRSMDRLGLHVNDRVDIHEKLAIIDETILWEGSMNILSHSRTSERMRRIVSSSETTAALQLHGLLDCTNCRKVSPEHSVGLVEQLVDARRAQSLSQAELARRCEVSPNAIARVESPDSDSRLSSLSRFAANLDHEIILVPKWLVPSVRNFISRESATGARKDAKQTAQANHAAKPIVKCGIQDGYIFERRDSRQS
ncbi:MAG: hypothetical protein K2W95_34155 [Candidatus Obscuribacterales bacterium]|nr:hypothetical protein [Candidatus Obscuribacterales bacterium]